MLNALISLATELGASSDSTNAMNALRCVTKAVNDLIKIEGTAQNLGYTSAAIALKALKQMKADPGLDIATKYQLDLSWLQGISKSWDYKGSGKTEAEVIDDTKRKLEHNRKCVTEACVKCLSQVERVASENGYSFERTKELLEAWRDSMEDDFHRLTVGEFYTEYCWKLQGVEIYRALEDRYVSLANALSLVHEVAPKRIYEELEALGSDLGTIRFETFNNWEARMVEASKEKPKVKRERLDKLKVEILGLGVHRLTPQSQPSRQEMPDPEQENLLSNILTSPEYSPFGDEFCVSDQTSLQEITHLYQALGGAK